MRLLFALGLAAAATAPAAAEYWSYRDWHTLVEAVATGEDLRRSCTAYTGGDGMPTLRIEVSDGDGGPPDFYPMARVTETAPRHYSTLMEPGQTVEFLFDHGGAAYGSASVWTSREGLISAESQLQPAMHLPMLLMMRSGSQVEIRTGGKPLLTASLNGFTAAYGRMMDECGFSLELPG
ncbi:hypothetical protein [Cribrihabitans neustonicus]|uniref:hypothetical protein n=1 Tax=Cribrihabitans neustonicus TaxID=1429085 RepID=UPI003B5AD984